MYPGIAIFTICLLYSYYKFNPQYILHSQSMVILQYCLNTPTRYVTRYFPTYFTPKLSTVLKHVTGIVPFFHRPGVSSQGKCLFFESLFMISLFIITPTCGNQYISHRISHTMKPFSLYPWDDIHQWYIAGWLLLVVSYTQIGTLACWGRSFYVNFHGFGAWNQQYDPEEQLRCEHISCGSSNFAEEID